jgi:hypothetical protein
MLIYLDSVICIYAVARAPSFQARARARLGVVDSETPPEMTKGSRN